MALNSLTYYRIYVENNNCMMYRSYFFLDMCDRYEKVRDVAMK